jgi:peptidoglycan lytic transglycosylase
MSSCIRLRFPWIGADENFCPSEITAVPYAAKLIALVFAALAIVVPSHAATPSQGSSAPDRHSSLQQRVSVLPGSNAAVGKHHASSTNARRASDEQNARYGLASFYGHRQTASGEKAANDLTAAHRTLPFGTMVRITNIATGQSVTVRINDRGPFVRGRIVDVSYSAAETLGIIERGIAEVKLDVVE